MTVRPEKGKFYKTRDGQKAGPMSLDGSVAHGVVNGELRMWYSNGSYHSGEEHHLDLVAEWTDEPKTLGEMSDEEASALWLAWRRGETIQYYSTFVGDWETVVSTTPRWSPNVKYRTKPNKTVPVSCYVGGSTHIEVGTIDLIDGKPDLTSLKARADE